MFNQIKKTAVYKYKSYRDGWYFPSNMAHTTGRLMVDLEYEPEVSETILSLLSAGDVFIDVGANVGYFSKLTSDVVGPSGRVLALEVELENFNALVGNTQGCDNVVPLNLAAAGENAVLSLSRSSHSSCHSLVDTDNHIIDETSWVPALTLDFLWEKYLEGRPVQLIKIDVEGAELSVLSGAERLIAEGAAANLIVEFCPRIMHNAGADPMEFYERLSASYSLGVLEREHRVTGPDGTLDDRDAFQTLTDHLLSYDNAENSNLVCRVRGEQR